MIEVYQNIFVGSYEDMLVLKESEWAFVHANKKMFDKLAGTCDQVVHEEGNRLFLNWIDVSDYKFFDYMGRGSEVVVKALDFIDEWRHKKKVIIQCDKGYSRSPSLALTWMAKRTNAISNESLKAAQKDFYKMYEEYDPSLGIEMFLFLNWDKIK